MTVLQDALVKKESDGPFAGRSYASVATLALFLGKDSDRRDAGIDSNRDHVRGRSARLLAAREALS
jgi:hypothetical protein